MREHFCHQLRSEPLFCKVCASVHEHRILAQVVYAAREPVAPRTPLLCECSHCQGQHILCSQEFAAFATPSASPELSCKVLGRGQLLAGDWVYVPGRPRPGRVKAVFHAQGQETTVIAYGDGTEERVSRTIKASESSENPSDKFLTYKLLPLQVAQTRIGDLVYHVQRECFGRAVGLQFGRESKLVLQLESGTLLLITLPDASQIPDNATLARMVRAQYVERLGTLPATVRVDAVQGLVYLLGDVPDLATRRVLHALGESLPQVRAVVDCIAVNPPLQLSDEELEVRIHGLLVSQGIPLIRSAVRVSQGHLVLSGYYRHESVPAEICALLEKEPLRGLNLELNYRPSEDAADKKRSQAVNQALHKYSRLQGTRIRATALDGVVFLEGIVSSTLQKKQAMFAAMIGGRNFRVENHLRVVRPALR